jgi:hypothetical protein
MGRSSQKLVIWGGLSGCLVDSARRVVRMEDFGRGLPVPFFGDALETISTLAERGHMQVLVTVYDEASCINRLRDLNDADMFFSEMRFGIRDKDAEFPRVLAESGFAPKNTVGITDNVSDARAFHNCGVLPLVVPRGFDSRDRILDAMPVIPTLRVVQCLRHLFDLFELK